MDDRPPHPALERRQPAPTFQPRFALLIVYLLGFFVLYAFLLVMPSLLQVLGEHPPGPEQQRIAQEVAREAARPYVLPALLLALATVGLGAWLEILPGFRRVR